MVNNYALSFTLHKQCREMLETYRRDDGIGHSVLKNYERCAKLHTRIQKSYADQKVRAAAPATSAAPQIVEEPDPVPLAETHTAEIVPIPLRPLAEPHVSFHELPQPSARVSNVVRVAFG